MRRIGAGTLVLALIVAGCVGGGTPAPDARSGAGSTPGSPAAPTTGGPSITTPETSPAASGSPGVPEPTIRRLPAITLLGDLSEPPPRWTPVMFVPFGDEPSGAGALLKKKFASQPIVPPSFAVDRDGSVWLLDLVKHRIAHYGPSGGFIGAIGGLEFSRFRPYAQDLAFVDGRLYVVEFTHHTLQTYVRTVSAEGLGRRVRVESDGKPVFISHLMSPAPEMTGYASGASGVAGRPPTSGFHGYWVIDPETGASRATRGMLMDDGSRLGTGGRLIRNGRTLLVVHRTGKGLSERALHLVVRPSAQSEVRIPVVAGWQTYVALPHGFATYAGFAPSRAADDRRYHGSERWLLEYFDDGQPLVWEPLPESPLDGAYVWRYLAEGLDGHLYLMLAERGGMRIYRRPGPPAS